MSLPAADLPEPIAVLVLAWDEATPAVRALVEATQASAPTVNSILVMVPQADAPDHLSAEEYLPLELPEPESATPAVEADAPAEASPPLAETPSPAPATTTILRAEALEEDSEPATDELLLPAPPAPNLGWTAVRVLRLGNYSLPQLASLAGQPLPAPIWLGPAALPAAPYLGAALPITPEAVPLAAVLQPAFTTGQPEAPVDAMAPEPGTHTAPAMPAPEYSASEPSAYATLADAAEPLPPTAALETDLLPSLADELEAFELASPDSATPEDAPLLPEQAGWPEALAALTQPTEVTMAEPIAPSPTQPAPASDTHPGTAHAALRPAAQHYPAPNLNFQIIQYARFAVPVALAEPAYEVIYAPAWPTWLAAQELRQRTARPLVLHLAALAAPSEESAETATGWVAELQRQALRRADLVLAETPVLAERLHHELGLAAGTVRVVAAADVEAVAQALHEARPRPA